MQYLFFTALSQQREKLSRASSQFVNLWFRVKDVVWAKGSSTYAMFPELFDHSQAEDVGYLCVHRETGGQDVSILTHTERQRENYSPTTFYGHKIEKKTRCDSELALYAPSETCTLYGLHLCLGKFPTRKADSKNANTPLKRN